MKRTLSNRDGDGLVAQGPDLAPASVVGAGASAALVESPGKKRQRFASPQSAVGGPLEQEEQEWNLLSELPYVVLRRLLDFLSFFPSFSSAPGGVPELLRMRAESEKERPQALPYHVWTTRQAQRHQEQQQQYECWSSSSSIGALRLTCRDIKSAVDHALGDSSLRLVAATALYAPLDRFLAKHAFPPSSSSRVLPLLSGIPEAARTKSWFSKMADVTLGTAQARLHQARLGEVLDYVWREWQLAPAKLGALRQQLLCAVSGRLADEVDHHRPPLSQPLLKVEYFQREDDYLGSSYALGVNSCISLGLPDMPQERANIWLNLMQAWDRFGGCWDLKVFVSLRTASDAWRQRLSYSATADGDDDNSDGDDGDKDDDHMILLDHNCSRGEIMGMSPMVRWDMLLKIWQCVGLTAERIDGEGADDGTADGEDEGKKKQQWNGAEVLTTLLACLGFAWKDDVELIPYDCGDDDDDAINEDMPRTCSHKVEVLSDWRQQAEQLSGLLEASIRSAPNEASGIKSLELAVRRIRCFIAQQRLSRAVSHIAYRAQSIGPQASQSTAELARLDGCEVAKELRVIYARTMGLYAGDYSKLSDATVELAWRIPADALRRVHDDLIASPAGSVGGEGNGLIHPQQQAHGGVELVLGMSIKLGKGYTGMHKQEMVTVRVVGHDSLQLRATLDRLAASAQVEERRPWWSRGKGSEEEEGVVVLQLTRVISDKGVSKKIMATEAIEFVGRLLGLSLRAGITTDAADQAPVLPAEEEQQLLQQQKRSYYGRVPDLKTTSFAQSVLAFVREVARATTWDADEGTFPVHAILRHMWDRGEDDGDSDDDIDDDDDSSDLGEDQGGQAGGVDPVLYEALLLCGPVPYTF